MSGSVPRWTTWRRCWSSASAPRAATRAVSRSSRRGHVSHTSSVESTPFDVGTQQRLQSTAVRSADPHVDPVVCTFIRYVHDESGSDVEAGGSPWPEGAQ